MTNAYDSQTGINFQTNGTDQGVFAEFYMNPVQNNFLTAKEGRPIFEDKVYIRIRTPGDRLSEVDREAKDQDKFRFALQWARFDRGMEQAKTGTPLEQWPLMTPSAVRNLKALNVSTVEEMATVTDGNLQHLGLGARALRDQARAYLDRANEGAETRRLAEENEQLRSQIQAQDENLKSLAEAVRKLEAKHGTAAE